MVVLATIVTIIVIWGVVSAPLDRRGVTSAMVFRGAGFLAGTTMLGFLDVLIESAAVGRLTEVALVLLLFSDAARLDLRALRSDLSWPSRLLLVGQPSALVAEGVWRMPHKRRQLTTADIERLGTESRPD
jgi:NhaP-type Na+/H+ or K+/H+ antiporter